MSEREDSEPRARILDSAKEVFAEKGFRGGSLNEVALRSGYTRAGLLHYYPSKEAILIALLEARDQDLGAWDGSAADAEYWATAARLPDLVSAVLDDRTLVQLGHVITSESSNPLHPGRDWALRRHQMLRRQSIDQIQRSIVRGETRPEAPAAVLASLVLGAVEGLENQWLLDPSVDVVAGTRLLMKLIADAYSVNDPLTESAPSSDGEKPSVEK